MAERGIPYIAEIAPGRPHVDTVQSILQITAITLGTNAKPKEVASVYVQVNNGTKGLLGNLREGKTEQINVEPAEFLPGEKISLTVEGQVAVVYVLGRLLQEEDQEEEDDEEDGEEEANELSEDESLDSEQLVPEYMPVKKGDKPLPAAVAAPSAKGHIATSTAKKAAAAPPAKRMKTIESDEEEDSGSELGAGAALPLAAEPSAAQNKVVTTQSGVQFKEVRIGSGPVTRTGDKVSVQYVGRLVKGGKVFDKGTFPFNLGRGEVIKGWDIGVAGMQVGGSRSLMIPAALGYGARGAPPDIPPNADLAFDVTLKSINPPTRKQKRFGKADRASKHQGDPRAF
jgi:FK506-binding nuclear protein